MEREPEAKDLGALGVAGIYGETLRALRRRHFARVAAFMGLLLSVVLLGNVVFARTIFCDVIAAFDSGVTGSDLTFRLVARWAGYLVLDAGYLLLIFVLLLAPTAFCVFSVASLYSVDDRDADARSAARVTRTVPKFWATLLMDAFGDASCVARVIRTGPKVWLVRLVTTCIDASLLLLGYTSVFGAALLAHHRLGAAPGQQSGLLLRAALLFGGAAYLTGVVYISAVWHLACVVSVLVDARSFRAMHESDALLAGKFRTAAAIFVFLDGCFVAVQAAFVVLVVDDRTGLGMWFRVPAGLAMVAALCAVVVVTLVAQVVVYFVCKSYHHHERVVVDRAPTATNLADVGRRGQATRRRQRSRGATGADGSKQRAHDHYNSATQLPV